MYGQSMTISLVGGGGGGECGGGGDAGLGSGFLWGWGSFRTLLFPVCPLHRRNFSGVGVLSFTYFGMFSLLFEYVYLLAMVRCLPSRVVMYAGVVRFLSDCFRRSRTLIPSCCCRRCRPLCLLFCYCISLLVDLDLYFRADMFTLGSPPL